jgi:hypothetical protein
MAKSIRIPNGILTVVDADFKCPKCECPHEEKDYYPKLSKSKNSFIYKKCIGCKTMLGITPDIRGDIRVWIKSEENDNQKIKI